MSDIRISAERIDQSDSKTSATSALQRLTEEAFIHLSTANGKGDRDPVQPGVSRPESNLITLPTANSRAQSKLDLPQIKVTEERGESDPVPPQLRSRPENELPRAVPAGSRPEIQAEKAPATPPRENQTPKPEQPQGDIQRLNGYKPGDRDINPAEKEKLESKPFVTDSQGRLTKYTDANRGVYKFEYANGSSDGRLSRIDLPEGKSIRVSPKSGAAVRFDATGEPEKLLATDAEMKLSLTGFYISGSRPGDDYGFGISGTQNSLDWQLQHRSRMLENTTDKTISKVDKNGRVESIDDRGKKYTFQWDQKNSFEMTKFIGPDGNGFEKIDGVVFSVQGGVYKAETEVGGKITPQDSGVKVFDNNGAELIKKIPSDNKAWKLMLVRRDFAETHKK